MDIDKWAERIYAEEDFGKNIATSIAGAVALIIYLVKSDFALAVFIAIIIFPPIKIISNHFEKRYVKNKKLRDIENQKKKQRKSSET